MNIESCFDFTGTSVLHIGAGGGQLIGYASKASHVLAVDPDPRAIARLRAVLRERRFEDRFTLRQCGVMEIGQRVDIAFFEFCLHEIEDPLASLVHARTLASRILVADHAPGSAWCDLMLEGDKLRASWAAVETFERIVDRRFDGEQKFHDQIELSAKLSSLGEQVIARARGYEGRCDFSIPMPYRVALLRGV